LGWCFSEVHVKELLNLPEQIKPLAIVPIGWYKKSAKPSKPKRKLLKTVIHFNKW